MGQRLCVNIQRDMSYESEEGDWETVINVYMHWSAYTAPSIEVISRLIAVWNPKVENEIPFKDLMETSKLKDELCLAMMEAWPGAKPMASEDGATDAPSVRLNLIANKMFKSAAAAFPSDDEYKRVSRNDGLIGFTEDGIQGNEDAAESTCTLYLDDSGTIKEINFGVCWIQSEDLEFESYKDSHEYASEDECKEAFEKSIYRQDKFNIKDIYEMPIDIDDWDAFAEEMNKAELAGHYLVGNTIKEGESAASRMVIEIIA